MDDDGLQAEASRPGNTTRYPCALPAVNLGRRFKQTDSPVTRFLLPLTHQQSAWVVGLSKRTVTRFSSALYLPAQRIKDV